MIPFQPADGLEGPCRFRRRELAYVIERRAIEDFRQQFDPAAAALAEFGPQRMAADGERTAGIHHLLGFSQRPPFERAAADRAVKAARREHQPGARLARRGAFDAEHRHHGAGLTGFERFRYVSPDLHADIALTAFMIASGVAGASRGGGVPGLRAASASVIAEKTDSASIKGGSPTAFER